MPQQTNTLKPPLSPCGVLRSRLQILFISSSTTVGAELSQALAVDRATKTTWVEVSSLKDAAAELRTTAFDALILYAEQGEELLEWVETLRASGMEEPLVVLGEVRPLEWEALLLEAGADAYADRNELTVRALLWLLSKAVERHELIGTQQRKVEAEQHQRQQEEDDFRQTLDLQQQTWETVGELCEQKETGEALPDSLRLYYQDVLRSQLISGGERVSHELQQLAQGLAAAQVSAASVMMLHGQAVEDLLAGLGPRSSRQLFPRATLLGWELLGYLAAAYQQKTLPVVKSNDPERAAG